MTPEEATALILRVRSSLSELPTQTREELLAEAQMLPALDEAGLL